MLVILFAFFTFTFVTPVRSVDKCYDIEISEQELTKYLEGQVENVQAFERPIKNASQPIKVGIGMVVLRLIDVNEHLQAISVEGYIAMVIFRL